jgi:hypothetical protein
LTQEGPGGKENSGHSTKVQFLRGENSGQDCAGLKEGIIGNDVFVSCLFLPPAQLDGICGADWGLGGLSQLIAQIAAKRGGADADADGPGRCAWATGAATAANAWAGPLLAVCGQCAGRGHVLPALRTGVWQPAAADAGAIQTAAAAGVGDVFLPDAGNNRAGGVFVLGV